MKISVIITTVLVAQVTASFLDVFNGAVLSVQNSFGKLLNDVVTDVKETVDCTILAVEHVLSLSPDATARYYEKCRGATNKTDAANADAQQDTSLPKVEVTFNLPNHDECLQKIPTEIDVKINATLGVLDDYKPHDAAVDIEKVLKNKESEQWAGVSVLVKKEFKKMSNEVNADLKDLQKQKNSVPSVNAILQEIKVLEKREQNTKNTSEAYELHKVIHQILAKLDAIKVTEATASIRLEDILKDIENDSNNSFVDLRQQFEEWKKEESTHLTELKNKIEDRGKIGDGLGLFYRHGPNDTQPVIFNETVIKSGSVEPTLSTQEISDKNTTQCEESFDYSLAPRMIGDSKDQSLSSIGHEPPSFQSGLNDTIMKSTSLSITENPFGNLSIPLQNYETNNTMAYYTTFMTKEHALINKTIQSVDNKTESTSVTTNDPTIVSSRNENNSTESGIICVPSSTSETSLSVISRPVPEETNTGSKNYKWADLNTNNSTTITNVTESPVADLTSTTHNTFNNDNANDGNATKPNKSNSLVKITSINATDSVNVEVSILSRKDLKTTLAPIKDISSNDTLITTSTSPKDINLTLNEACPIVEISTIPIINVESSSLTMEIVGENSTSLLMIVNTTASETTQPQETTTVFDQKEFITDSNITEIAALDKTIKLEETSTTPCDEKNTKMKDKDLRTLEITPASEIIESPKPIATSSNENTSNILNVISLVSTGLPIIKSKSNTTESITTTSSNKEYSTESKLKLSNTEHYNNLNSSNKTTLTPLMRKYESKIIDRAIDTTTGTDHRTIPTISESILTENITASKNEERFLTTNSPIFSMTTLINSDFSTVIITNKRILMNEAINTTVNTDDATMLKTSENTHTENITVSEIEKPFLLTTDSPINTPILMNETIDITTITDGTTVSTILENTPTEKITVAEFEKPFLMTTDSPIVFTTELMDTDFNTDMITNTPILMNDTIDITTSTDDATVLTISESTPTEKITVTELEEPFLLTTDSLIVSTTELMDTDFNSDIITDTTILMNETIDITTSIDDATVLTISESTPSEKITIAELEKPFLFTTDSSIVSTTELMDTDFNTDMITNTPILMNDTIDITTITDDATVSTNSESTPNEKIIVGELEEPFLLTTDSPFVSTTESMYTDFNTDIITNTPNITTITDDAPVSTISESTPSEIITVTGNEEPLLLTTDSPIVSTMLIDTGFNTDSITNTQMPTSEIKTVNAIVADTESCVTVTNTKILNTDFETATETIGITAASEEQDLPSTSTATDVFTSTSTDVFTSTSTDVFTSTSTDVDVKSVLNENVTTDATLPPSEKKPITETITTIESSSISENDELRIAAFEDFDSITKRLLRSESLHDSSSMPLIKIAPELNTESLSYVPTKPHPYFFTENPSEVVLTTHRPKRKLGRAKNRRTQTMDYGSFFNTSQKDAEAHQQVLKEARQFIANSRRSARVIDNIMKNKNKYNAGSMFNR